MRVLSLAALLVAGVCAALPVQANDSVAEIGAGGIVLGRSNEIRLEREDLFISRDLVTVDYVFRNEGDKDIETLVAFPMPAIAGYYEGDVSVPDMESDNFLGFSVTHDGATITPQLQQRAVAAGVDVTDELLAQGVPLIPFAERTTQSLEALADDVAADWQVRGLIQEEIWDAGKGPERHRFARWELHSVYWWKAVFPAGRPVHVSHRYRPAVGATVGLSFYWDGQRGDAWDYYADKYCIDGAFEKAMARASSAEPGLFESRIDYILTSGGNWASGTIGTFHLTVDKGSTSNLVSFCGAGVKKTGPTRFEMTVQDFYPERDVHILLLERIGQ